VRSSSEHVDESQSTDAATCDGDARDDAVAAAALSLSDGVRRGPNDLKIENETTHFMLRWRRVASTTSTHD